ncbi:TPA: hypothetical protein PCJ90_001347 [Klebsiella quasipneumoniae]|nr:hypothetical protein [Klebsiella quasipneumoniae]
MADYDNLNYGIGTHVLDTQSQYNDNQQNQLGQSLATTTPSGSIPASDPNNDLMTDFERKRAAQQAKIDTLPAHDTEGKYIFRDGTVMDKTPDTRKSVAISGALSFAAGYFSHMGNQDEAIAAGTQNAGLTISAHEDRIKREALLPSLEAKTDSFGNPLYNSVDMMKYVETGDSDDLTKNMGKWIPDGKGFMHNTLTGQSRQIEGFPTASPKLTHIDLGNRDVFVDAQGNEVHSYEKGQSPDSAAKVGANDSLDNSGDDGTGTGGKADSSHMVITDPDGSVWHVAVNSRGTPIVDKNTGMATVYNDKGETSSRVYNPTYTQQSGQISQEALNNIQELSQPGALDDTGTGLMTRGKRAWSDISGGNYTADTQSKFDTINDQAHAFAVNKLIQEGVRPTEELVRAEMKRYGHLDINNSPEQNKAILDKMQGAFNAGYNAAATHQTHTEMKQTDRSNPYSVEPTRASAATQSKNGKKDFSHMW